MATVSAIFVLLSALTGIGATAVRKSIGEVVADPVGAGRARRLQAAGRRRAALVLAGIAVLFGILAIVLGASSVLSWILGIVVTGVGALTLYRTLTAPVVVPEG